MRLEEAFPPLARLPEDRDAVDSVARAAVALEAKLARLEPRELGLSDYMRVYLEGQLRNVPGTVQKYALILAWALSGMDRPVAQATVLDYGGGTGLLADLARLAGARTVIYNDIFPASSQDAATLARALDTAADAYVPGDLPDAIAAFRERGFQAQSVVSNDVIEHVYRPLEAVLRVRELGTGPLVAVWATDATTWNPLIRRRRARIHRQVENSPRPDFMGRKPTDDLRAYRDVRAAMIRESFPHLTTETIALMAAATRGRRHEDVLAAVAGFERDGVEPRAPLHPTNTCDPLTGNWAENMLDWDELESTLRRERFATRIVGGVHARPRALWKRPVALGVNALRRVLGERLGLTVSPWHILWTRSPGG